MLFFLILSYPGLFKNIPHVWFLRLYSFLKNPQYDFPKMRGGGVKAVWNFSENSSVLVGLPFPNQHPLINPFISLLIPISHSLRRGGVQERVPLSRVTLPCYPTTLICPREENIWETSRWKIYFSTNVLFGFTILDWMAVWLQRPCLVSIKS